MRSRIKRHARACGHLAENRRCPPGDSRLRGGPPKRHDALFSMLWWQLLLSLILLVSAPFAYAATAYVTNVKDDTVSVIDLDSWSVTKTFEVGQRPRGIALSPDNKILYVCT